jgi:hypothetical protein
MRDVRRLASLPDDFQNAAAPEARPERAKSAAPFSLRLSAQERATLEADAGNLPLGEYIRRRVFGEDASPRRRVPRRPGPDHELLARVLAELGRSRLASNLNQLAKAANTGALPVSREIAAELAAACADVREMRATLLRAMGLPPSSEDYGATIPPSSEDYGEGGQA